MRQMAYVNQNTYFFSYEIRLNASAGAAYLKTIAWVDRRSKYLRSAKTIRWWY